MIRKIAPLQDLKKAPISIRDPEKWSEIDFLNTSLSHLSKTLSQTLTNQATLTVYFKWLEAHRRQETELTQDWGDTLFRWVSELRFRGFSREDLIVAVRAYKDREGISDSPINNSSRHPTTRCFPMVYDINKAWAGAYPGAKNQEYYWSGSGKYVMEPYKQEKQPFKKENMPFKKEKQYHRQEDFEGIPPGNYTCNRCHQKGMCGLNTSLNIGSLCLPSMGYRSIDSTRQSFVSLPL